MQLVEKQKLRATYGVREAQLRRFYDEAQRQPGLAGENLLVLLERRLDSIVRRLGFATTIWQARQLVVHGHVAVNGKRVDRPSYVVDPGDEIEMSDEGNIHVREAVVQTQNVPDYLTRNDAGLRGTLVRIPSRQEIPYPVPIDERLIVEFYAR